jgi:hypothetical protein
MTPNRAPETNRLYARVANFPNKLANLRAKIEALRDEAGELGFREEAAHLSALAVFANSMPEQAPKLVHWTGAEVTQLKALWLEGIMIAEIARRLDKTPKAVQRAIDRYGLPVRKKRRTA